MVAAAPPSGRRRPLPPWWHTDAARWYVAAGTGLALALTLQPLRDDVDAAVPLTAYRWVLCYAVTMLVFAALTLHAFSRHHDQNATKDITGRDRPPTVRDLLPGALAGVLALAVAVWYIPFAADLSDPLARLVGGACAVLLVVAAWLTTTVAFAAVYARWERHGGDLVLPGRRSRGFTDHLYLSVAVGSTMGATDAAVRDSAGRRLVLVHSVLAFVFNAVVLALLVTSLAL